MPLRNTFFLIFIGVLAFGARPFGTDDAGIVPGGNYELEIGYDFWKQAGTIVPCFKHGLTGKMDLAIGFGYNIVTEPKNTFLPAGVCLKYGIITDLIAVSFATELKELSYTITGIATRTFEPIEFNFNFGYSTGNSSIIYAGCLKFLSGRFAPGIEIIGNKETQTWLAGFSCTLIEGLAIDAGFSSNFEFEEKFLTAGIHYEF